MDAKECRKCGRVLPLDQYWGRSDRPRTSLQSRCIDCASEWHRDYRLMKKYGITREQYDAMLVAQSGGCAICGKPGSDSRNGLLHVDHSHDTGAIRGLLCFSCNSGIGRFSDDTELISRALDYLRRTA